VAKKDRVPTPPKRPVQAPKAYKPESNPRRTRLIFIALAVVIVVAAGALGAAFMLGGDDSAASGPSTQGDCTFQTFDHKETDGVDGFVTITGGKGTTLRAMAELCGDVVCTKLGIDEPCTTRETGLLPHPAYYAG